MYRNKILYLVFFALILVSLLAALAPFTDIDHDGLPDSLVTEGFILLPVLFTFSTLVSLLITQTLPRLPAPVSRATCFTPPPIIN